MKDSPVYAKQTIEFVTVAAEYCAFIEKCQTMEKAEFIDKSIKLLPLLYLKALLLPQTDFSFEEDLEKFVNETTYEYVRSGIASIMGAQDDYLEVFIDDMQYSESAISAHISEDLTDIYQDIKDFISIFALGYEATMNDALALVSSNFKEYWGQKTVNVLRPLHSISFGDNNEDFDSSVRTW